MYYDHEKNFFKIKPRQISSHLKLFSEKVKCCANLKSGDILYISGWGHTISRNEPYMLETYIDGYAVRIHKLYYINEGQEYVFNHYAALSKIIKKI